MCFHVARRCVRATLFLLFALSYGFMATPASAISSRTLFTPTGAAAGDTFGHTVATAGDVNGDGYADVIVGAVRAVGFAGRAYVYYGGPGADAVADLTLTGAETGADFGISVGTAGDVNGDGYADVIVGAPLSDAGGANAGRAYVYYGGPGTDAVADLTLTGAAANDNLGCSVATAGDVNGDGYADVIVGARGNDAGGSEAGRAYVYYGGPGADAVADLTLTGAAIGDNFGYSVATAGDVNGDGYADVIVGAPLEDAGGSDAGRAYVYYGGPGADAIADLTLTGAAYIDYFGYSVATAGDVNGDGCADVIVGAFGNDAGGTEAGRAYVYYGGPGADTIADLTLTGAAIGGSFGISVGTAGDVNGDRYADVIVGAFRDDAGGVEAGRAYVYYGGPGADTIADLTFTGTAIGDNFGISVGTAGDVNGDGYADIIVGAILNDAGGVDAGRAYVTAIYPYEVLSPNGGEQWVAGQPTSVRWRGHDVADVDLSLDGGLSWQNLARSVGGEAVNELPVVAPGPATELARVRLSYSGQPVTRATSDMSERAFRIVLSEIAPAAAARLKLTPTGAAALDGLGISVGTAGDVNGDGFADLIVGAPNNDAGGLNAGRAYVYYGGPGADAVADLTLTGTGAFASFGGSVGTAGDVNGDGYADVIVGSSGAAVGAGRAYLYYGGPGADAIADLTFTDAAAGDAFGTSVGTAGDVNRDGYADVIVGAPGAGGGTGRAYLYYGGPGANAVVDLTLTGAATGDKFGISVGAAGDVNGDGCADVIVGAQLNDAAGVDAGRVYVFYGGPGTDTVVDLTLTGAAAGDQFGYSIGTAGDVNGDGFADLIVGAPNNDAGGTDAGRAYVYYGGPGADATPDLTLTGAAGLDLFGYSVGTAGDVNGDGYADVIVGALLNDAGGVDAGRAYVYYGGPGADAIADLTLTGAAAGDYFGGSVGAAGDVNGDGFADIIVGAAGNDAGGNGAGRAYIYNINRYHVLAPAAGVTWNVGARQSISWLGPEPADVWLSVDGGANFALLRSGVGGEATNVLSIRVPHQPTRFAKVRIAPADPSLSGLSETDSLFTIQSSVVLLAFKASCGAEGTALSWSSDPAVGAEGILGYRLYRIGPDESGEGVKIGGDLMTDTHYTDATGAPGATYRLAAVNGLGEELELGRVASGQAIRDMKVWPSPVVIAGGASSSTAIHVAFAAPVGTLGFPVNDLEVAVFNVGGRRVVSLARGQVAATGGVVTLDWNGRDGAGTAVAPGIYFVRASAPSASFDLSRKLIVTR